MVGSEVEFAEALAAEGIPCLDGYVPINRNEAIVDEIRGSADTSPIRVPAPSGGRGRGHGVLLPILMADGDLDDVVARSEGRPVPRVTETARPVTFGLVGAGAS